MQLAAAEAARGQFERALGTLDRASRQAPLSAPAQVLRVHLLTRAERLDEALEVGRRVYEEYPLRADCARIYYRVLLKTRGVAEALPVLKDALKHWPTDVRFLSAMNRLPVDEKCYLELYSLIEAQCRQRPMTNNATFLFAQASLQLGQLEAACEVLERITENSIVARRLHKALTIWPSETWQRRARIRNDSSLSVQKVATHGAIGTVVVFPGGWNKFDQFPLTLLDALLSDYPLNVIYLQDTKLHGFLDGIPAMGETPEAGAVALKSMVARLGAARTFTMGISFGGFAALRYGSLIDADAALTVAGYTHLPVLGDDVDDEEHKLLKPIFQNYTARERDALPDVSQSTSMRVTQVVGTENTADRRQARRLEHLPNVTTHLVPNVKEHVGVLQELVGTGQFTNLMALWLNPPVGA